MKTFLIAAAATLAAGAALAESHASGDPAAGEKAFKLCQSCHVVKNPDGNVLAGRSGKTGPNLYGVAGGTAGAVEGFRYGKDMVAAGEAGLTWTEENFMAFVQDPTGFLREFTGNSKARAKMTFKVRKEEDARNIFAFLASIGPMMMDDSGN